MKSRIVFTAALVGGALGVAQALRSERTRSAAQGAYRAASDTARTRAAMTAERLDVMARDIGSQVQVQIARIQRNRGDDLTAVKHVGKVRAAWFQDAFGVRSFCELAALDPTEISERMAADRQVATMSVQLVAEVLESAGELCAQSRHDIRIGVDMGVVPGNGSEESDGGEQVAPEPGDEPDPGV